MPQDSRFWDGSHGLGNIDLAAILSAPAQLSGTERLLLFALVRNLSPSVAVEVGTFQGGSATIITSALRSAGSGRLWCIEPYPRLQIDWTRIADVATLIQEASPEAFATVARQIPGPIEFAFIDGEHSYEAVLRDTRGVLPHLADHAWLLFHDAASSLVGAAIDQVLREDPHLQDAGMLGRYFNVQQWPGELYGGLRLLHFERHRHRPWVPASARNPRVDSLPERISITDRDGICQAIDRMLQAGQTTIGLHGVTPRLAGLVPALARYNGEIVILDDDPLLEGQQILGWPIISPQNAKERGVAAVLSLESPDESRDTTLANLREQGITISSPDLTSRPILSKTLGRPRRFPSPDRRLFEATKTCYLHDGCRRFAVLGTGPVMQRTLGRLLIARPYPKVVGILRGSGTDSLRGSGTEVQPSWGLPVVAWEELGAHKVDCLLVASTEELQTATQELEKRGLNIRIASPARLRFWFGPRRA